MSRACDIIASKSVLFGNNVSHSNRKTQKKFIPNLRKKTLISQVMNRKLNLKIATSTLKSIENAGGIDEYLSKTSKKILTDKAKSLKVKITKFKRDQV